MFPSYRQGTRAWGERGTVRLRVHIQACVFSHFLTLAAAPVCVGLCLLFFPAQQGRVINSHHTCFLRAWK